LCRASTFFAQQGVDGRDKPGHDGGYHAAFAFASWIARHTRSGVSGMSIWVIPYSDSASITALTTQTRLPAQPASPQPLVPSGLDFAGEGWSPTSIGGMSSARGRA